MTITHVTRPVFAGFVVWLALTASAPADSTAQKAVMETSDTTKRADSAHGDTDDGLLLRYRFRKGDILRYEMKQVGELEATVNGREESEVTLLEQTRRFHVTSVDAAGTAQLAMQFEHVKMSVRKDDQPPVSFHTGMPSKDVPKIFRAAAHQLKRAAPQFVAHPTGPVLNDAEHKTEVSDDRPDRADDDVPDADVTIPLPDTAVQVGDSWKSYNTVQVRIAEGVMRTVRLLTSWKLQSVEQGKARITYSTSPIGRIRSPLVQAQLIEMTPKGHVLFDVASGRMVKRVTRTNKSVFNAMGPNTLLTSSKETIEKLLPEEKTVSRR